MAIFMVMGFSEKNTVKQARFHILAMKMSVEF